MTDLYAILGIQRTASQAEVKSAYKQLAKQLHPDLNPGDPKAEDRFKVLTLAYEVLVDPDKRRQYDLLWEYEQNTTQTSTDPYHSSYRQRTASQPPPANTKDSGWDYDKARDERLGILLGIVGTGIIALLVLLFFGYRWYAHDQQVKAIEAKRKLILGDAIGYRQQGQYREAFLDLAKRPSAHPLIEDFRQEMLHELDDLADSTYHTADYQAAARYLELLYDFSGKYDPVVSNRLALSYQHLGQCEQAIDVLRSDHAHDTLNYETLIRMGDLQKNCRKDIRAAMQHYDQATLLIAKSYEGQYGMAYALLLDPGKTSGAQYELFVHRAECLLDMGNLSRAQNDCAWAIFLRPERPEAYFWKGNIAKMQRNTREACQAWQKAAQFGYVPALEALAAHCP